MVANSTIITQEEVTKLEEALRHKINTPGMTYEDIFSGLEDIHPQYKRKKVIFGVVVGGVMCLSLSGIIFLEAKSNLYLISIIIYIASTIATYIFFDKFKIKYASIIISALILILFIATTRTFDIEYFKHLLEK